MKPHHSSTPPRMRSGLSAMRIYRNWFKDTTTRYVRSTLRCYMKAANLNARWGRCVRATQKVLCQRGACHA